MEMESVGSRLRAARKANGLTLEAAAELCGTSSNSIWRWENGVYPVTSLNLRGLGEVYGVSYEELCGHGGGGAAPGPDTTQEIVEVLGDLYGSLLQIASRSGLSLDQLLGSTKHPPRRRKCHGLALFSRDRGRRMD